MAKVFVPNRSHHDFSDAERFGELIFLTEGYQNRFNINHIYRMCLAGMQHAEVGDFILVTSLPIINAAAATIMAQRFGRVNYLTYNSTYNRYEASSIILDGTMPV